MQNAGETDPKANKKYDYLLKILLVGGSDSGKSKILFRFCADTRTFVFTIGTDFLSRTVEINGKKVKLLVFDTAGQERFQTITTSYVRGAQGIMFVYDVRNLETFSTVSKWLNNVKDQPLSKDAELMLLGNHCEDTEDRKVSREEGEEFAKEHNMKFFEVSAKHNINIDDAFITLATDIINKKELSESEKTLLDDQMVEKNVEKSNQSNCSLM